jgi:hypothetical protein
MALAMTSESVLHAITPGHCEDLIYPGSTNTAVQCFNAINDNRFTISLPSVNQGSTSQLIFNPSQGLSDIIISATIPGSTSASVNTGPWGGYALPTGWLAAMINTIALRVGGSSLYYWTGAQILVDTLQECENNGKQQSVFNLGGAALYQGSAVPTSTGGTVSAAVQMPVSTPGSQLYTAAVYLKMPFNSISSLMKTLPLATDLLTQPVQFLITWKNFADVAFPFGNNTVGNLPTAFTSVSARFRQTTLVNSEHLLARREDMNSKMLVVPLRSFAQTEFTTQVAATAGQSVSINATGLRSGSIKWIDVYVSSPAVTGAGNNWNFVPINALTMLVNGLIYYDAQNAETQLWNLCDSNLPLSVTTCAYTAAGGNVLNAVTGSMPWYRIQLGQRPYALAYENEMSLGLNIANSVVNINLTVPVTETITVRLVYHYACNLVATKGTMEYLFT